MSMARDSSSPELSSVVVGDNDGEIELSLGLSIGRGFSKSPKFQNSGENFSAESTDVVVTSPNKADRSLFLRCSVAQALGDSEQEGDSHHGDTEGNSKVQTHCRGKERKRKRNEKEEKTCYDAIRERSNERETIDSIGCKFFTNGETNSSDAQVHSKPVLQQDESDILKSEVLRSFSLNQGNQELVTGGGCSGGKDDENTKRISPAGSSSILSSGFKSSASQPDGCRKGGEEDGTEPNMKGPSCFHHHDHPYLQGGGGGAENHKPSPSNTQLEGTHNDHQNLRPPRIPCVTTTGNGPNGRTVSGFLYKYTNAEVSIVCACHGCSFSPAQFVEHAGGVNISHPLRHITVFTSSFHPFAS